MTPRPAPDYEGRHGPVNWHGVVLTAATLKGLRAVVRERLFDLRQTTELEEELQALATTQMASDNIKAVLEAVSEPAPWEVGEAIAEATLEAWHGAVWPWNTMRDRRAPQASLPGADLVGLAQGDGWIRLLFGEVKSSSDERRPPHVLYGRSGMIQQLERIVGDRKAQRALIHWLRPRCHAAGLEDEYREAVGRFVSEGELILVGCLVRDVEPHEDDVRSRSVTLSKTVVAPTRATLTGYYLPIPMDDWSEWVGGHDA